MLLYRSGEPTNEWKLSFYSQEILLYTGTIFGHYGWPFEKITDQWIKLLDLKTQHFRIADCVSLSTSSVLIGAWKPKKSCWGWWFFPMILPFWQAFRWLLSCTCLSLNSGASHENWSLPTKMLVAFWLEPPLTKKKQNQESRWIEDKHPNFYMTKIEITRLLSSPYSIQALYSLQKHCTGAPTLLTSMWFGGSGNVGSPNKWTKRINAQTLKCREVNKSNWKLVYILSNYMYM